MPLANSHRSTRRDWMRLAAHNAYSQPVDNGVLLFSDCGPFCEIVDCQASRGLGFASGDRRLQLQAYRASGSQRKKDLSAENVT